MGREVGIASPDVRVLQILTSACAGGLSRYVLGMLPHLTGCGVESHLACTHARGPHFEEMSRLVAATYVTEAHSQLSKLRWLVRTIRTVRPDAVHCHQEPVGLIAARLCGVPTRIETVHNSDYWSMDGHPLVWQVARFCTTQILVNNDTEQAVVSERFRFGPVTLAPPGVDWNALPVPFPRSDAVEYGLPAGAGPIIGTIGRLDPLKGVTHLIAAFAEILRAYPHAALLIVGDGPERDALAEQVNVLGVGSRVRFAGYQVEAARWLGVMDLFVSASYRESLGLAVLEAAGMGVPVICSDIPGHRSIVESGRTGLTVKPKDTAALTAGMMSALKEPALTKRMALDARDRVRRGFSAEQFALKLAASYRYSQRRRAAS